MWKPFTRPTRRALVPAWRGYYNGSWLLVSRACSIDQTTAECRVILGQASGVHVIRVSLHPTGSRINATGLSYLYSLLSLCPSEWWIGDLVDAMPWNDPSFTDVPVLYRCDFDPMSLKVDHGTFCPTLRWEGLPLTWSA